LKSDLKWKVYMIECSGNSLYTGIATDVAKRFEQHRIGEGAKFFYTCKPEKIVYVEQYHNRSTASQREIEIKNLTRKEKLQLISTTALPEF
jgi:putative endonuclease